MTNLDASQRLMELVFQAVEEAFLPLRKKQALVPFALLLTKTGIVMQRYVAETASAALAKGYARLASADEDTLAYALVYDGLVSIGGSDTDAILIEAAERGRERGYRFAQRYRPPLAALPLMPLGELAYLGNSDSLLIKK